MIKKILASILSISLGLMLLFHAARVLGQSELSSLVIVSGIVTGIYGISTLFLIITSWVSPKGQWVSSATGASILYLLFELYSTTTDVAEIGDKIISYLIMVLLSGLIYWSIKTINKPNKEINNDAPDAAHII